MLSINDHSRNSAGLTYVYPVVSRRAGGVSLGINLNTNNACNWACIYCQVPDLKRGGPPPVDLVLLEHELRTFLNEVVHGDYLSQNAPPGAQRLVDVAFSGNGEPTSAPEFFAAVECVETQLRAQNLIDTVKIRVITNGSMLHRPTVRQGIARIGELSGEIWFKVDRATPSGVALVNGTPFSLDRTKRNLFECSRLAPTWVQTCWFAIDGKEADEAQKEDYLRLLDSAKNRIQGVLLYGLARPSMQAAAHRATPLAAEALQAFADRIASLGIKVVATP